jgi:hypothetical protein
MPLIERRAATAHVVTARLSPYTARIESTSAAATSALGDLDE